MAESSRDPWSQLVGIKYLLRRVAGLAAAMAPAGFSGGKGGIGPGEGGRPDGESHLFGNALSSVSRKIFARGDRKEVPRTTANTRNLEKGALNR